MGASLASSPDLNHIVQSLKHLSSAPRDQTSKVAYVAFCWAREVLLCQPLSDNRRSTVDGRGR